MAGRALLCAWLLLGLSVAATALYVYLPQIEAQVAGLTGSEPAPGDLADVEVESSPAIPPVTDAVPADGQPELPESDLELAGPQSAPLSDLDAGPETDSAAIPSPARPPQDLEQSPVPGQSASPESPAEEIGSLASEQPLENETSGAQVTPPPAEEQTAALPTVPEAAPPPAPTPPVVPAWQRFSRPFSPPEERPLIAIVITGLGLNGPRTLQAIEQLPPEISLSFSPYAKQTEEFMRTARAFGHEVLIDLPMEPATRDDPGTLALLTGAGPDDNLERLDLVLSRGRDYVGVVGALGSRFVGNSQALTPVLNEVARRGLLYVDNRPVDTPHAARLAKSLGLPVAINDRRLDARMAATPAVDASLAQVERIARERGTAVALGQPNPTTLAILVDWARSLPGKGLALAPVSAIADRQPVP